MSKALAEELKNRFLPLSASDLLDMYKGNNTKNLKAAFEAAFSASPCFLVSYSFMLLIM